MALELEDGRLKSIPEGGGQNGCSSETEGNHGQVAGDAKAVHAGVEPAEEDKDHDVGHIEAIADAAVVGRGPAAEQGIDGVSGAGGGDESQNAAGKAGGDRGIEIGSASGNGGRCPDAQDQSTQAQAEPGAAAEANGVQRQ